MIYGKFLLLVATLLLPVAVVLGQTPNSSASDTVRVTVSMHSDGTRTIYQFDQVNHKATATTTSSDGKPRGKMVYELDDAGRFINGEMYGAKGDFRFKALYKYDAAGRLTQETQLAKDDSVMHKLVYTYDERGQQSGYAIYDADGRLLGQTTPKKSQAGGRTNSKSAPRRPQ
ncbi:MAG: hypothetical protein ABJB32_01905 [Verrucomicrobiota bacterium]